MSDTGIIQCRQMIPAELNFDYQGNALDFDLQPGEMVSIIGPDYSGKARWLKTMCGLEDTASGSVFIHGADTMNLSASEWTMTRMKVAYLHADTALLSAANGLINTLAPALYHQIDQKHKDRILAEEALNLLEEIDPDINLDDLPAYISKEHRFKIAVARALLLEPDVLALNDPFAHFNKNSKHRFQAFLKAQQKKGLSLLIVTHDIPYAISNSDRIIFTGRDNLYHFDSRQAILDSDIPVVHEYIYLNT